MRYKVTVTLTEPILGSTPKDANVYESFVQSKAAELNDDDAAQELATLDTLGERGYTGFHTDDEDNPLIYDYVIKGFFKAAAGALRRVDGTLSKNLTAYKVVINTLVFVFPRQIIIQLPEGGEMTTLERPLRASTAQGERVALAKSDVLPAGSVLEFEIEMMPTRGLNEAVLREWLDYGKYSGLGQWRNAGYGRFSYIMEAMVEQE